MENIMNNPVIGVVMCRNRLKGHATQTLQEKYLNAIIHAGGLPIALPHALAEPSLLEQLPHFRHLPGFTGTGGGNRWFVASQAVRTA